MARSDVSASQHRNVGDIERRLTWPASQSARSTRIDVGQTSGRVCGNFRRDFKDWTYALTSASTGPNIAVKGKHEIAVDYEEFMPQAKP